MYAGILCPPPSTNMFNLKEKAVKEHADLFGDRLYSIEFDDNKFVLRYAACHQQFAMIKNWHAILGVLFYGLSSIIFIIVLKMTDLSIAYPMTSMSYIFVTIFSYKFLGEKINKYKMMGIVLIIIGVVLVKI